MSLEMPSRSAAVFIAFILFWSAFATFGQAGVAAPLVGAQAEAQSMADSPRRDATGASEQQQEDESAAASQAEGSADSPELIPHLPDPCVLALAMARPRPLEAAAWRAPALDGLRRPPRGSLPTA